MDAYRGNKAAPRRSPTDTIQFSADTTPDSNQEQFDTSGPRTIPIGNNLNAGNQVRVQANNQNTSQVKNPLQKYQRLILPDVQNPDEGSERSTRRVAKKASPTPVL